MNVAATNGTFNSSTQTVATHGTFNGWGTFNLTNDPSGPNPLLYSGTTNIPDNGNVLTYKYTIEPGATYEGSHNRLLDLPTTSGGSLIAPVAFFNDTPPDGTPAATVTFRVNMAQQINVNAFDPNASFVYTRGGLNGWNTDVSMTNDPSILTTNQFGLVSSNVYLATYSINGSPGQTIDFKFFIDTGANWEGLPAGPGIDPNDNNNRFFNLSTSSPQTLPILFFNNLPFAPVATNAVTFQVDMTTQVGLGNFDPNTGTVELRGNFNGWGTPQILLTNNPAGANTNLYSIVVPLSDGVGATEQYKFWSSVSANGGWETLANNRTMKIISGTSQVLPPVFFNDELPSDFLTADTVVTFSVNMTNAVGTDAHTFDPANDHVFVNGIFGFVGWDPTSLAAFELTNNPVGSKIYSLDVLVPKNSPLRVTYKYSINGADNEAANNVNHVRYIRLTGTYVMPLDTFGSAVVEPLVGTLTIGSQSGGQLPLSWAGRPGVHLQSSTSDICRGRFPSRPDAAQRQTRRA